MYPLERQRWLVDTARSSGRIEVPAVAAELGVAVETIRRDLNLLEGRGLVRRVHGGAIPVEKLGYESTLVGRSLVNIDEKRLIAQAAIDQIDEAETIFIDEGATATVFANAFSPHRPMTVVTSSLPVASTLSANELLTVYILGGRVRANTLGAVDHFATNMLERMVLDLAILGTNGATAKHGLTCSDTAVAAVKAAAIKSSRRTIVLADSSKIGTDSSIKFADLHDLDVLITERSVPDQLLQPFKRVGVTVIQT